MLKINKKSKGNDTVLKSMTGYGRAQQCIDNYEITVEIKSVNHRFFEFNAKTPRAYGYLDEKLKSFVQRSVSRGKIDVGVTIYKTEGLSSEVEVNKALAGEYVNALRQLEGELNLKDDLTLSSISRFSDIFTVKKINEDEQVVWEYVSEVANQAVEKFVAMRADEGKQMKKDLVEKLEHIESLVTKLEEQSPNTVMAYRERLTAKMNEVLGAQNRDESRILLEAAIFSEKVAVDEETVRLRSHIKQFYNLLEAKEPIGRKLDFLVQELNREANTIGSKAQDVEMTAVVVDIKSDIEKIREQIQNIE